MPNFYLPEYDIIRAWIRAKREKQGWTWERFQYAGKNSLEEFNQYLPDLIDIANWPPITYEDWTELVRLQKEAEENTIRIIEQSGLATIHDGYEANDVSVPQEAKSAWQCYKRGLKESGWNEESILTIEKASLDILKRLTLSQEKSPIKGLVIGNVQSGKTANMAALMAMAADWGWNMFIILSGTVDNLRRQTQDRLYNDLTRKSPSIQWITHPYLSGNSPTGSRAQDLNFRKDSPMRYFTVCLKHATRLENLIDWLHKDRNSAQQMRILVIDDEADQAGINTASVEDEKKRRRINKLIINLVNGNKSNGENVDYSFGAMNYIGYTATPYANILNESTEYSLYPRNFITTLQVSKEYFGPQQIFGVEDGDFDGLDIIRDITPQELEMIKDIHNNGSTNIPKSLENAICWFLCGTAFLRKQGYRKPLSMLVHTSQKTDHHAHIANAIRNWIEYTQKDDILKKCESLWEAERRKFDKKALREQYGSYNIPDENISELLNFSKIKEQLEELLEGQRISSIYLNEDNELTYHNGIHLCVDNCTNNGVGDDGEFLRLVYPNKDNMPELAPAFIVVGGTTLSRGLTIEGLISTYFLRVVKQADTLMQMGRWFGYRRGYELVPRLWLTRNTRDQFKFLSVLDQELRDEIHEMAVMGKSPIEYAPKVRNSPKLSWIRITARNRMQTIENAEMDYSGAFNQTILFDNDEEVLRNNLEVTKLFLDALGEPCERKDCNRHSANAETWRGIKFDAIKTFLYQYKFQARQTVFNNIASVCEWIEKTTNDGRLTDWNVVLAGKDQTGNDSIWEFEHGSVAKVQRSQMKDNAVPNVFNIRTLRVPKDLIADIDLENASEEVRFKVENFDSKYAKELRSLAGLSNTPQLIIYIIDKDSKARDNSTTRKDLNAPVDLVGLCVNIPGGQKGANFVARVQVRLPDNNVFDSQLDIEENEN